MKKLAVMSAIMMPLLIVGCLPPAPVEVGMSVSLPPPIVFSEPPEMVVLPDTDVYVVPDYDQDIYFYGGWWWRPWGGRWYRSLYYDSGWEFYNGVPGWYGGVYPHWRDNYRNHMWGGHRWDYRPVPSKDVRTNWKGWQSSGYWRNQQNRGTTGSYHQGVETRRDFRGFPQETRTQQVPVTTRRAPSETRGQQAPVATHQGPATPQGPRGPVVTRQAPSETRGQQAPVATHQGPTTQQGPRGPVAGRPAPDLSKNKNSFAGVGRGSDARIQSDRGRQSRESMSSTGKGSGSRDKGGRSR